MSSLVPRSAQGKRDTADGVTTLTAAPTIIVGAVPVVITLDLAVYADVSADGTVALDTTQSYDGDWAAHASPAPPATPTRRPAVGLAERRRRGARLGTPA
jgi:hypothetical protein